MAGNFVAANSQRFNLSSSVPITAAPFTVGMWVNPNSTTTTRLWYLGNSASSVNQFLMTASTTLGATIRDSINSVSVTASATLTVGLWHFIVARFIASNNNKVSALVNGGTISHATSATAATPSGSNTMTIGDAELAASPGGFFDGRIGEFWMTNTDVQPGGLQLQNATLLKLAYGGPLSISEVARNLVEYLPMRRFLPGSNINQIEENFYPKLGRLVWTNTNGVTIGSHPPLPYWYERFGQTREALVI